MAINNTTASLDGLFKRIYADKVINLIPDNVTLYNMVSFQAADRLGDSYRQPVIVQHEQGYTYGGNSGTAFTLNDAIAGQVADANIKGYESMMRTKIAYAVASRSATSEAAFEQGTKLIVANMLRSFAKRLEISLLYGQKEIGFVNANTSASTSFVVSDASWAPGIWNGLEQATVQVYSSDLLTERTSGATSINAVNLETKTVTVAATLTLTAGDRVLFAGELSAVLPGGSFNEMLGLHGVMTAYTDGKTDLFGINPASFNVWRSSVFSAGSADLSFKKIQEAIAQGAGRGLDEDVECLVSMRTWSKLCTDQAALRLYDQSYRREVNENGAESIKFYGQTGVIEIMPSAYVKESLAFIFPKASLMRIGSTDITFRLPGHDNDRFFRELTDSAGFELRAYSDQALFSPTPNKLVLINSIVNS